MRYLWDTPHWLDDPKFAELCPEFQPTDLTEAMRAAAAVKLANAKTGKNRVYSNSRSPQTIL